MRIFRTCRVMNIATVAIYTRVDRGALHVRYAEEAYCISDSPEDTSYLKPEKILQIAKRRELPFIRDMAFCLRMQTSPVVVRKRGYLYWSECRYYCPNGY